ncbi:uncharacterized protein [Maniola hyperantus]|uniref:uncharacterized protein n=1 Tax=Aphantopus hyperantus TaxID=2795564 RepID=UPI001569EB36|nr:uncharacterized protein LOC117985415 isoform X2 [Maniola hyperantus]XP_034828033.1 uncharacterized protein LOC117985415 isoform X2 [Maniola hyperantus]XP_034828040.1 uncharacterized protein LOC117985415 isoform X2 [Maniola hyperantus]
MSRVTGNVGSVDKRGSMSVRLRYLFLLATVFGGSFLIVSINKISEIVYLNNDASMELIRHKVLSSVFSESYTIKTKGCSIPALRHLGEEVKNLVRFPKEMKPCPKSYLALLANNRTHIWVRNENKEHYKITSERHFICCYKSFYRPLSISDITAMYIDDRVNYSDCKKFSNIIDVSDEFVKVECNVDAVTVYQQYFVFTPKKKASYEIPNNKTSYNVIVMGIDAVSRLNFYRTMPNTLTFLKEHSAIELLGYNKVGDNTFPNLVPMLMGFSDQDLNTTCTPNERSFFDNCPFIWEYFKQAGFYTAFGEDSSSLGTFNYEQAGFIGTPTDYYIHTFINEAEHNVGNNQDFNSLLCMNDKYFYAVLLDYIENLTLTLKTNKLFGFFWEVTMSHDYLNYPMIMDNDYSIFFKRLHDSGYLNDTIVFLVSDHGIRWGEIRSTNQGRLEERLPFVYILTPPTFRKKYQQAYKNLRLNRLRLTTPYDVHATLFDLINLEQIENQMIEIRSNQSYVTRNKGVSLFLPVPFNRTCAMANIDDHWCSCHKGKKLSAKSIKALEIAGRLVQELNLMLRDYSQCARLKLTEVEEVTEMEVSSPENDLEFMEYMVVIRTEPGNARFEGTLRNNSETWSLSGTVSRLNLYGSQSHCIHNYLLKLYCYCNNN